MRVGSKNKSLTDQSYIVFVDEAGFMNAPTIRRTWAPRGHTPVIKITSPHSRISAIGAITVRRGDWFSGFHYKLSADNVNFHGPDVVIFIDELSHKLKGQMTVVWDEISIHRGSEMKRYLSDHPLIEVVEFPSYAPELNPVDLVWGYVKYNRLANYCSNNLEEMRAMLIPEFERLKRRRKLLRSFLTHVGFFDDE